MFLLLNIFIIASSFSRSRDRRVRLISGLQRCFKIHHPVLPFRPADHATNNDEDDVGVCGDGDADGGCDGNGDSNDVMTMMVVKVWVCILISKQLLYFPILTLCELQ